MRNIVTFYKILTFWVSCFDFAIKSGPVKIDLTLGSSTLVPELCNETLRSILTGQIGALDAEFRQILRDLQVLRTLFRLCRQIVAG